MPDCILAIDQGTTGTTVLVVDSSGAIMGRGYHEHPQHFPLPGLGFLYSNVGNYLVVAGRFADTQCIRSLKRNLMRANTLPIEAFAGPQIVQELGFSDHRNYWSHGYPAVMVTDTAFLRNPNYHTSNDTVDTLDFGRMAAAARAIAVALQAGERK